MAKAKKKTTTTKKKTIKKKTIKKATPKKAIPKKAAKKNSKPKLKLSKADLQSGDTAPQFDVKNQEGQIVTNTNFSGKTVVLYFYPKDLTPGCTVEACDFRDSMNRLKSRNVDVYGVSMDNEQLHKRFIEKYNLNFDLLSDLDGKLCFDYGVLKEKNMYGRKYVGIARTTFIINDGKIAKKYDNVKVTGHVDQILNDLESL